MDSKITTGTTADSTPYVDEEHQHSDHELYAAMVRLRLSYVLDQAGDVFAETYRDPNRGAQRWEQMLDEATRQVMRDVVDPLAMDAALHRAVAKTAQATGGRNASDA